VEQEALVVMLLDSGVAELEMAGARAAAQLAVDAGCKVRLVAQHCLPPLLRVASHAPDEPLLRTCLVCFLNLSTNGNNQVRRWLTTARSILSIYNRERRPQDMCVNN
jgi:hypothetical protein